MQVVYASCNQSTNSCFVCMADKFSILYFLSFISDIVNTNCAYQILRLVSTVIKQSVQPSGTTAWVAAAFLFFTSSVKWQQKHLQQHSLLYNCEMVLFTCSSAHTHTNFDPYFVNWMAECFVDVNYKSLFKYQFKEKDLTVVYMSAALIINQYCLTLCRITRY